METDGIDEAFEATLREINGEKLVVEVQVQHLKRDASSREA